MKNRYTAVCVCLFIFAMKGVGQNFISIDLDTTRRFNLNKDVYGVNSNLFFKEYDYNSPIVLQNYQLIGKPVMRAPGGTVGNYYDFSIGRAAVPSTVPKGINTSDPADKGGPWARVENINNNLDRVKKDGKQDLSDYIDFMKKSQSTNVYMLNITLNNAEKNKTLLETIKRSGQTLKYVELGNELYFNIYEWAEKNVHTYIDNCRLQSAMVKSVFPDAKVGIIIPSHLYTSESFLTDVGSADSDRQKEWYKTVKGIQTESFFDAVIIHTYSTTGMKNTVLESQWLPLKTAYTRAIAHVDAKFNKVMDILKSDFPQKEVWVTEYHIGGFSGTLSNYPLRETYLGALHTLDQLLKLFAHSNVTLSSWHQFSSLIHNDRVGATLNGDFFNMFNQAVHLNDKVSVVNITGLAGYSLKSGTEHDGTYPDVDALWFYGAQNGHLVLINKGQNSYRLKVKELIGKLGVSNNKPVCIALCPANTLGLDSALESKTERSLNTIKPNRGSFSVQPFGVYVFEFRKKP